MARKPKDPSAPKKAKTPEHPGVMRAFRYLMGVEGAETTPLHGAIDDVHAIRNALAAEMEAERIANRALRASGVAKKDIRWKKRQDWFLRLTAIAAGMNLHSQVKQDVVMRLEKATKNWLASLRSRSSRKVSPPKPIKRSLYHSLTYPQYGNGVKIKNRHVECSKLGRFKLKMHRKWYGTPKTVTISFEHGQWWCIVTCLVPAAIAHRPKAATAALPDGAGDPGLTALLVTADRGRFDPPKALKNALDNLRHESKTLSRKFEVRKTHYANAVAAAKAAGAPPLPALREIPYSNRLKAQIVKVAKIHTRITNVRDYHQFKIASIIENMYRCFAFEEHPIAFMLRNRKTARAAADRAIGTLKERVQAKLGDRYYPAPNRNKDGGNSQTCLCGQSVPKELNERLHVCPRCGLTEDRDVVAANRCMQHVFGYCAIKPPGDEPLWRYRGQTADGQSVVGVGATKVDFRKGIGESETSAVMHMPRASEVAVNRRTLASMRNVSRVGNLP